jgi:hypothetical protein
MSWGYFLDLNLTIPTSEWERVAQTKTSDHAIGAGWWGFKDKVLGEMFSASEFDEMTIGEVIGLFNRVESIGKVDINGDMTTIRLCQLLDRGGEPSIAKSVAALVDAAKESATATLRLVNDGSYSGEDGVEIVAADGQLSRSLIEGSNDIAMRLGSEIYGGEIDEDGLEDELDLAFEGATVDAEEMASGEGAQVLAAAVAADQAGAAWDEEAGAMRSTEPAEATSPAKPARAKPTSAKKPPAKQAAAKKAAAKKPAAKKPAAKKPAAKKASAKKPTAKKAAAKTSAAKKPAAKMAPAKKPAAKKPTTKKSAAKKPAAKKKRR